MLNNDLENLSDEELRKRLFFLKRERKKRKPPQQQKKSSEDLSEVTISNILKLIGEKNGKRV